VNGNNGVVAESNIDYDRGLSACSTPEAIPNMEIAFVGEKVVKRGNNRGTGITQGIERDQGARSILVLG